jgi:hypothetical protein
MGNALTTFTDFVIKPSAPFAAGIVLFGAVWGFFKGVESVLTDQTKFEIAVWLVGVKAGQKLEPWPETFATVFDRVFGTRHLSWKCFLRSCVASLSVTCIGAVGVGSIPRFETTVGAYLAWWLRVLIFFMACNAIPDYLSLLETRWVLRTIRNGQSGRVTVAAVLLDGLFSLGFAFMAFHVSYWLRDAVHDVRIGSPGYARVSIGKIGALFLHPTDVAPGDVNWLLQSHRYVYLVLPAFFTSIWLWLYAGSGFLLKAAQRFDVGFDWFNRHFDIEKHPLSSIGLVAGALVALAYWTAVIVSRLVK